MISQRLVDQCIYIYIQYIFVHDMICIDDINVMYYWPPEAAR